jgi:NAD(P)-dependent dehydrogenase (short-subunit alcohol dehydrogenase family)
VGRDPLAGIRYIRPQAVEAFGLAAPSPVAVVTGAGTGFGRSTALHLAQSGYRVFAGIRDTKGRNASCVSDLVAASARVNLAVSILDMDVTDDDSVNDAIEKAAAVGGRIDALVNNAGFGIHGPWELMTITDAKSQFETNFFGAFRAAKAVAPIMQAQGSGTIIGISSDVAIHVSFLESIYAASKWALEAMSLGMRYELQQFGIRVCVVEPGLYTGTEYDNKLRTNIDYSNPTGDYAPLVRRFDRMWREREQNHTDIDDVARAVSAILSSSNPPFRTRVGCELPRTAQLSDDEYEELLFRHYEMGEFRRETTDPRR